ncbi:MAG: DNA primase [Parcubacteria group bacterium]|nr:DNA primase [Parcubacteria group bacterium]
MSSPVEQIKERLSIVDVVSSYVKLERAGKNYKARCPFHNEKTPSFFVSPERDTYHCFGCDNGGDVFQFVQDMEGLDFSGALKVLAERAGVPLRSYHPAEDEARARLFRVLESAARFFENELARNADARAYLAARSVSPETARAFRVGFAPASWQALTTFLRNEGFRDADLFESGCAIRGSDGRLYDRFRSRIMFPIADASGRVVGFSGRIFGTEDGATAKYVNSPETPLFHKSKLLYGLSKAKSHMRRLGKAMVVEGQMDVVLSHQAGIEYAVAPSGTALSDDHLDFLRRMANTLIFAFDADAAGRAALERSVGRALTRGFSVLLIRLPHGEDPASVAAADASRWNEIAERTMHVIEFYLAILKEEHGGDAHAYRTRVEQAVVPFVARLGSPIEQAHFVSRIAEELALPEEAIWESVRRVKPSPSPEAGASLPGSKEKRIAPPEKAGGEAAPDAVLRRLLGLLLWTKKMPAPPIDLGSADERLLRVTGKTFTENIARYDTAAQGRMLFEAEMYYTDTEAPRLAAEFEELCARGEERVLKRRLAETLKELQAAERAQSEERTEELLRACQSVSRELHALSERLRAFSK